MAKSKGKRTGKGTGTRYSVTEVGEYILIKRERKGVHKRLTHRPPVKIATPNTPLDGCHLTGTLYDQKKDETTFMYECDQVVNRETGSHAYTVKKKGRPAA
jgi:hypothetical protein